ncbi:MAG: hypothetical protein R3B70_24365 [Polyangiaceae bacterium]
MKLVVVALTLAFAFVLAGCGDEKGSGAAPAGSGTAAAGTAAPAGSGTAAPGTGGW